MTLVPAVDTTDQESMRSRILDKATRLFVTNGYAAISMREIAEAVGVSKAGLYYHFKDKEDLFIAILKDNLEEIGDIISRAIQSAPDVRTRLRNLIIWIFEQSPQQRAVIRLANQEMGNINPQTRSTFNTLYHAKFIGQIEAILQEGVSRKELRPFPTAVICWVLLGMMYPFLSPDPSRDDMHPDILADQILGIFFDGLGTSSDNS